MSASGLVNLTELLGRPVHSANGHRVGQVDDLSVRFGDQRPKVTGVLVRARGGRRLVPWTGGWVSAQQDVAAVPSIVIRDDAPTGAAVDLRADELLLRRDVLDCQIIDLKGHRLTRASDVVLGRTSEGAIALVGVEVGVRAILRRLGLGWLAGRLAGHLVPMEQLHLTSSRGHQVQLVSATSAMHQLDSVGLAHLLTRLDVGQATEVMTTVGPERAASALLRTHPVVGRRLMSALPPAESSRIRRHLGHASRHTHPHLHDRTPLRRRSRRLAGWRTHHPPGAPS